MKIVPIFASTGSGLHCPKILINTYASRVKFHKSPFWVLILAAGGPYWVSISQKNGSLLGPYLKAWGSLIVLPTAPLSSGPKVLAQVRFFIKWIYFSIKSEKSDFFVVRFLTQ